jgi:hypothetical protein
VVFALLGEGGETARGGFEEDDKLGQGGVESVAVEGGAETEGGHRGEGVFLGLSEGIFSCLDFLFYAREVFFRFFEAGLAFCKGVFTVLEILLPVGHFLLGGFFLGCSLGFLELGACLGNAFVGPADPLALGVSHEGIGGVVFGHPFLGIFEGDHRFVFGFQGRGEGGPFWRADLGDALGERGPQRLEGFGVLFLELLSLGGQDDCRGLVGESDRSPGGGKEKSCGDFEEGFHRVVLGD